MLIRYTLSGICATMEECYKFIAASKTASEKRKAPTNKGKPKSKTALIATDTEDHASTAEPEAYMSGYYAYSVNVTGSKLTAWDFILDTGASGSIINNKDLLQKVKKMKRSVTFGGISGTLTADQSGRVKDLCAACYYPEAPATIISFSQLRAEGHKITMGEDNTFTVKTQHHMYRFIHRKNGLYVYRAEEPTPVLIISVKQNEHHHT